MSNEKNNSYVPTPVVDHVPLKEPEPNTNYYPVYPEVTHYLPINPYSSH